MHHIPTIERGAYVTHCPDHFLCILRHVRMFTVRSSYTCRMRKVCLLCDHIGVDRALHALLEAVLERAEAVGARQVLHG